MVAYHLLELGVDRADGIAVLDAHIHPRAVARRPNPMGEGTGGNCRDPLKGIGAEDLHLIQETAQALHTPLFGKARISRVKEL